MNRFLFNLERFLLQLYLLRWDYLDIAESEQTASSSFLTLYVIPVRRAQDLIQLTQSINAGFKSRFKLPAADQIPSAGEGLFRILQSFQAL